ncbi:MAG: Outer membrane lipoprotein Blc [Paracidovorax wautersii]|uniref:Outer membrane lipoprotein Blc n=1 Tax=Paracidovorax wautersii TaxID=1177982 RepID=A0A7V8FSF4_9BURK|nr:MAG: Outer membrane lipoprotein Blc [Paracidovorax wautersii]
MSFFARTPKKVAEAGKDLRAARPLRRGRARAAQRLASAAPVARASPARAGALLTPRTAAWLGVAGVAGVAAYLAVRHVRSGQDGQTLPVVADVDLARFCGTWYEQARLPNRFQRYGDGQVSAHYSLRRDGAVQVLNRFVGQDGHVEAVQGVARRLAVPGVHRPGRLGVRFASAWLSWLPAVWHDHWVIQLDEDYQHVLIGSPDRRCLWVLSRRPRLQAAVVRDLLGYAGVLGFPVRRVIKTAV